MITTPLEVVTRPDSTWWELADVDPESLGEHCTGWLRAMHRIAGHRDVSRGYITPDGRRFILPLAEPARRPRCASGFATGWGIGGLVGPGLDQDVVDAVVEDLAHSGMLRLTVRPEPRQAALWDRAAPASVVRVPRRAHVLDLPGDPDALLAGFSKNGRRNVRTALKRGVEVRRDVAGELVGDYLSLRERSLERWATTTRMPLPLLRARDRRIDPPAKVAVWREELGDRCQLRVAFHEGARSRPASSSSVRTPITPAG